MLLSRSIANAAASAPMLGRVSFPEKSEFGVPGVADAHDGGGGGGAGYVGVEFTSLANTGIPRASASKLAANVFRQVFIGDLLKTGYWLFTFSV